MVLAPRPRRRRHHCWSGGLVTPAAGRLRLQANAVSSAFWTIGFLLLPENSQHLAAVVAEAWQAAAAGAGGGGAAGGGVRPGARGRHGAEGEGWLPLSEAQQEGLVALAADRRSHAAAAVAEALRLRSFRWDPPVLQQLHLYIQYKVQLHLDIDLSLYLC